MDTIDKHDGPACQAWVAPVLENIGDTLDVSAKSGSAHDTHGSATSS